MCSSPDRAWTSDPGLATCRPVATWSGDLSPSVDGFPDPRRKAAALSAPEQPPFGAVAWRDLTVRNAEAVRDFYAAVAGWSFAPVPMGEHVDYEMRDGTGRTVAGICHASGPNADLPPQWLIYIVVPDLAAAIAACEAHGGALVAGPRDLGGAGFCVIRDPAGAVAALYEPAGADPGAVADAP